MSTQRPDDGTPPDKPEIERTSGTEQQPIPAEDRSPTAGANSAASPDDRSSAGAGSPASSDAPDRPTPGTPVSPRRGSVRRQEAGVTQPRPPTVAEARARDKARKRAEETQRAATAAAEAKKRKRKRVMIGGVAVVGVAGLVGGGYLAYRALTAPDQVTASCVKLENGQEVVVDDNYCGDGRAGFISDSGGGGGTGPGVIILGGGPQYRYYYGGTGTIGKPPTGGTTVKPRTAEIKTKSGTTVQRGGLGSKSGGGS
ncbi:hypothetical protein AB0C34_03150 [Nocardia sp. NPDC049220]|uniref:hypothetical protein n=1 Tax=Nocardia sp. NPDC049220 TaxID=3155273 RepID=UPI0033F8DDD8